MKYIYRAVAARNLSFCRKPSQSVLFTTSFLRSLGCGCADLYRLPLVDDRGVPFQAVSLCSCGAKTGKKGFPRNTGQNPAARRMNSRNSHKQPLIRRRALKGFNIWKEPHFWTAVKNFTTLHHNRDSPDPTPSFSICTYTHTYICVCICLSFQ